MSYTILFLLNHGCCRLVPGSHVIFYLLVIFTLT